MMGAMIDQDLSQAMVPQNTIFTSVVVGLSVAILAATIPAIQAGRVSPLEALRIRSRTRKSWLMRFSGLIGIVLLAVSVVILVMNPFPYDVQFRLGSMVVVFLFLGGTLLIPGSVVIWEWVMRPLILLFYGRSGRLGSSNVGRARLRTTLTVAALLVGVSMVVVVWAMTDSFKGDLVVWLEGYMGGDLYVSSPVGMGTDVWKRLASVEGVKAVSPVRYFDVEWYTSAGETEKIAFMAVDPNSHSRVTSFMFSAADPDPESSLEKLAAGDTVFVSSVLSEKYHLKPGDTIFLMTKTHVHPFYVAAVVVDYYNQGMVVSGSWEDMQKYYRFRDAMAFLVKVEDGDSIQDVGDRIDDLYGRRDRLTITSNQDLMEGVYSLMDQAFSMFDVLAMIAILVGFFGIANTLTMNVMERTREIGMLRGMGMTRGQVTRMILSEAALMGIIGGIMGVIFGVVLARIFMLAMTAMSGYQLEFVLPSQKIWIALFIAVVISQVAAFFPSIRAARIRILEAIQYE